MAPAASASFDEDHHHHPLLSSNPNPTEEPATNPPRHLRLHLLIYSALLLLGSISSHLLLITLFHLHGGYPSSSLRWFYTALSTCAFPILLLLPIIIPTLRSEPPLLIPPSLLASSFALGLTFTLASPFFASSSSSSIFTSARLPFTALFASLILRRRPNTYSLNSVVVLTSAALLPALVSSSSSSSSSSLIALVGCSLVHGVVLPCVEKLLAYYYYYCCCCCYHARAPRPRGRRIVVGWVMQFQLVFAWGCTTAAVVGMVVDREFDALVREFGWCCWYVVVVVMAGIALSGLMVVVGLLGLAHSSSALFAAVLATAAFPFRDVAASIIFGPSPTADSLIAMAMSLWGLLSYLAGDNLLQGASAANDDDDDGHGPDDS